ncbi:MAG: ABC transporter ATP-binding protein [Pelagibacterales bacterium]|jgi:ABC-type lipoprotein export system ATPase subunit|nr:ABC transporter ATP-binding protein [Pelagibacterales bacterium]
MTNVSFITIKDLTKTYEDAGKKIIVFDRLNLNLDKNSIISLVGPSGSGKSSLLHILAMLDTFDGGSYFFDSKNISSFSLSEKNLNRATKISIVYQFNNLISDLNALENVALPLLINKEEKSFALQQAEAMMIKVGLEARIKHFPNQLSGGEQQRVAIARAIITEPELILADEPTGNLDKNNSLEIFNLLKSLKSKNRLILFATHNRELSSMTDIQLEISNSSVKRIE